MFTVPALAMAFVLGCVFVLLCDLSQAHKFKLERDAALEAYAELKKSMDRHRPERFTTLLSSVKSPGLGETRYADFRVSVDLVWLEKQARALKLPVSHVADPYDFKNAHAYWHDMLRVVLERGLRPDDAKLQADLDQLQKSQPGSDTLELPDEFVAKHVDVKATLKDSSFSALAAQYMDYGPSVLSKVSVSRLMLDPERLYTALELANCGALIRRLRRWQARFITLERLAHFVAAYSDHSAQLDKDNLEGLLNHYLDVSRTYPHVHGGIINGVMVVDYATHLLQVLPE